ncbi:MAG: O-antigen ligase family protein [Planctomycetota bacterium]
MRSKLSIFCDKFIEAGWLAGIILTPLFMNIYTHRMFEPDKASLLRSIAILMLVFYLIKKLEGFIPTKNKPSGATPTAEPKSDWRLSLFFPALVFVSSYTLSCITSATPYASVWGSYDRLQGLYTFSAYIIIFFLAAAHIKTRRQVERIFTAVILTSVPITAYGLIQKMGWDPVPWQQMDPTTRISATMGNPIFLAAYLIMVSPLALARLAKAIYKFDSLAISFYTVLYLSLFLATFLSQSRGPMLGLISGTVAFVFIFAWKEKIRWLFNTILITAAGGVIFLSIFNITHIASWDKIPAGKSIQPVWEKSFGKMRHIPYFGRLGFIMEHKSGTGRVRMILWKGVMQLITESPFRFIVGHGPESLATVYYRYHSMELSRAEGSSVHADRSHNVILDCWVTQGIIGLISYLFLISSIIFLSLRALKRAPPGNGKPAGSPDNRGEQRWTDLLLIGLVAAIIGHVTETIFGIPIVSTNTHFWIYAAALFVLTRIKVGNLPAIPKEQLPESNTPVFDWSYYIFWAYVGFTLMLEIILVQYYWPNENTDTNAFIQGTYVWLGIGLILGAFAVKSAVKSGDALMKASNSLLYLLILAVALAVIIKSNYNPIAADGYYKFCFSYDGGAEGLLRNPPPGISREDIVKKAFETRLISVPFYIHALRLAPDEKAYLNGAGRNFLEMSKLKQLVPENSTYKRKDERNKLTAGLPAMKELLKRDFQDFLRFTEHDYFLCSAACIQDAYDIEPNNYERILGMVRIYRYWGQMDQDESKLIKSLDYCRDASLVAPLIDIPYRESREILASIERLHANPNIR